ncbi:MAG: hypothetical protein IT521_09060 [Burkholderiales bacterium]|nr:hypothetical protein [Burkholderiales bacterium]
MNKLLIALIAGAFATVAAAQTAPAKPTAKERQQAVQSTTQSQTDTSSGMKTAEQQKANVKASKEVAKMTTAEKKAFMDEINKTMVNPQGSGVAAVEAQQKANVEASKGMPRANVELKTKEGQKQIQKGLEKAATK